jgi:hypothetical protein
MKINIRKSKLHGKGLFASRAIKKDEKIFTIKGQKLKFLIHNKKQAELAGFNWIGLGKNIWINPTHHGLYFNHSCNPNSAIKGTKTAVAIRNIKKDEEITFDYSLNEADIFWYIKCSCGSKNCRKTIRSIQFLHPKKFEKYKTCIPKDFQKIYKKFNTTKFKDPQKMKAEWINFIKKDFSV